jgi:hypothetical protein
VGKGQMEPMRMEMVLEGGVGWQQWGGRVSDSLSGSL